MNKLPAKKHNHFAEDDPYNGSLDDYARVIGPGIFVSLIIVCGVIAIVGFAIVSLVTMWPLI